MESVLPDNSSTGHHFDHNYTLGAEINSEMFKPQNFITAIFAVYVAERKWVVTAGRIGAAGSTVTNYSLGIDSYKKILLFVFPSGLQLMPV